MRVMSLAVVFVEGVADALVGGAGLAGAAGDFGGGDPGVEPQGYGGVPQVVGAAGQRGCLLGGGERDGAGALPDFTPSGVVQRPASCGAEQAPVWAGAVAGDVGAEHADQDGRDGDAAGLAGRAVLEAAFLAAGTVVGPTGAGAGPGGGQVDPAPPAGGQDAVSFAQRDRLGGSQGRVVQAAEERLHVLTARALPSHGFQESPGLDGVGDRAPVDGLR